MKKYLNHLIIFLNLFILIELFINRELIFNTIGYSLNIWVNSLLPSLFPFFIIADFLISYNIINYIPLSIKKLLSKLFNISDNGITLFILSLISGFPSNARNAKTLYNKKLLSKDEASHILMFTHFANPLFVISTVGIGFFNDKKMGIIILISHYLSNFIIGILFRNLNTKAKKELQDNNSFPFIGKVFSTSINNSINSLLNILGTLTCFLILSNIIINFLHLNDYNSTLIKSILELTMGLKNLSLLNISKLYKTIIASSILSFGGLSVHMQVISEIYDTDISYKYFFHGRIYQTIISGIISFLLFNWFY